MSKPDYKSSPDYQKGLDVFDSKYDPGHKSLIDDLYQFSPDLADVVVAHGLSDIWVTKTPSLSVLEKEIAVLSSLISGGTVPYEIKAHTHCLLNVGATKEQIKELLVLLTLYIGVPKVIFAMNIVNEAFEEYDKNNG